MKKKTGNTWQDIASDWLYSIIVAVVLAFCIRTFVVEPYMVSGPSMLPTLENGERLLVNKFIYFVADPQRDEIIVFKYPMDESRDFIKRVIEPAKRELDAMCVSSFAFEPIKTGQKVTSIQFTPIHRREHTAEELAAMIPVSAMIDTELKIFMINAFGFTVKELGAHKILLDNFNKIPYKFDILYSLRDRVRRKNRSKGYVIEAMRGEVSTFKERLKNIQKNNQK